MNRPRSIALANRPLNAGLFSRSATKPTSLSNFVSAGCGYSFSEDALDDTDYSEHPNWFRIASSIQIRFPR